MKAWILILIIICTAGSAILLHRSLVVEAIEIYMSVKVGDHLGLNADSDALRFGMVMPGAEGVREMSIANRHGFSVKVQIRTSGEMGSWVRVSENNFIILPNDAKNVTFIVHPPTPEPGEYEGKAIIVLRRSLGFIS